MFLAPRKHKTTALTVFLLLIAKITVFTLFCGPDLAKTLVFTQFSACCKMSFSYAENTKTLYFTLLLLPGGRTNCPKRVQKWTFWCLCWNHLKMPIFPPGDPRSLLVTRHHDCAYLCVSFWRLFSSRVSEALKIHRETRNSGTGNNGYKLKELINCSWCQSFAKGVNVLICIDSSHGNWKRQLLDHLVLPQLQMVGPLCFAKNVFQKINYFFNRSLSKSNSWRLPTLRKHWAF